MNYMDGIWLISNQHMLNCMKTYKVNNWRLMCLQLASIGGCILVNGYGRTRCGHQNYGRANLRMDDNRKKQHMYMFK